VYCNRESTNTGSSVQAEKLSKLKVRAGGWKVPGGCCASRKEETIVSVNLGQH